MGRTLSDVVASLTSELLATPGVVGVAEGSVRGSPCVVIYVQDEAPPGLPTDVDGYSVDVRRSGPIEAQ